MPRVTTIPFGTPSVNSRNFSSTMGVACAPWCEAKPELAHLSDSELSSLTNSAGPIPYQGLSSRIL